MVRSCFGGGWFDLMCDNLGKIDGFIRLLLYFCYLYNFWIKLLWLNCCVRRGFFLYLYICSLWKFFYEFFMYGYVLRWLIYKKIF